jgi:signal transduction histidine kinase
VTLALSHDDGEVRLSVSDDGVGIQPDRLKGSGSGLVGMRERAATYGGGVTVDSPPEGGTRVALALPGVA